MKNLIGAMTLMFCITAGISDACVTVSTDSGTYTIDSSGCVGE